MQAPELWEQPLSAEMLPAPDYPLSNDEIAKLWSLFTAIADHWKLTDLDVGLFRSRWLDMLEARCSGAPDYRGEYVNAVEVSEALVTALGRETAIDTIYGKTVVTTAAQATTRLGHAKFFVINDFIRCFIACGGFRGFVPHARNYSGFMGGSRFREWTSVRTRNRR
jgi:hypothetical protein